MHVLISCHTTTSCRLLANACVLLSTMVLLQIAVGRSIISVGVSIRPRRGIVEYPGREVGEGGGEGRKNGCIKGILFLGHNSHCQGMWRFHDFTVVSKC